MDKPEITGMIMVECRRVRMLLVLALVAASAARADVVTFQMTGVHWHNTTYVGNASIPLVLDWYGTGTLTWTYTPGNFQAGQGSLVSLGLPPWGVGPGGYPTTTLVDVNGISTTLNANVDNLSYDIAMTFSPALTGPDQAVSISGGTYQFYPGTYTYLTGEYDGTIIGGTVSVCPTITIQPVAAVSCTFGAASFSVTAAGSGPFTYQWQLETAPGVWTTLGNDPGPLPCGGFAYATPLESPTVDIGVRNCPGTYGVRCVVSNACGGATSNAVPLTVEASMAADFDHDCSVDAADFAVFAACVTGPAVPYNPAALPPGCTLTPDGSGHIAADFNADGVVDMDDFGIFQRCYSGVGRPVDPKCTK